MSKIISASMIITTDMGVIAFGTACPSEELANIANKVLLAAGKGFQECNDELTKLQEELNKTPPSTSEEDMEEMAVRNSEVRFILPKLHQLVEGLRKHRQLAVKLASIAEAIGASGSVDVTKLSKILGEETISSEPCALGKSLWQHIKNGDKPEMAHLESGLKECSGCPSEGNCRTQKKVQEASEGSIGAMLDLAFGESLSEYGGDHEVPSINSPSPSKLIN